MDNCLPNYFFDFDFTGFNFQNTNGYKINKKEELILFDGDLLMKTLYMEAVSLQRYISLEDRIEPGLLAKHNLKFQIDGNTIFHLFALDTQSLNLICEYLEENKKDYLNGILMKNYEGETPLDITINNDSPKNTDIMLRSLSKIKEAKYSEQFYKRFSELLGMELKSFHHYLESCRFQTVQMQNTKYLALKDNTDLLVIAHNTCVLDQNFIEKYTKIGHSDRELRQKQKEILAKERKFAAQQRREAEAERKKRLEERKKKEMQKKQSKGRSTKGKSSKHIKTGEIILESSSQLNNAPLSISSDYYHRESNNSEYSDFFSYDDSYTPDAYSNLSSSFTSSPARAFPESHLSIRQLAKLQKEKSKMLHRDLQRKEKRQKLHLQKKKAREEKEKAQQELIQAEKLKIIEERERQREALNKGLKRYDVTAIEFDWLFGEDGRGFIVELTKVKSLEIFSIDLVIRIVLFLWTYYRRAILIKIMLPFLVYFGVFLFYATWTHFEKYEEADENGGWHTANLILIIIIALFIVYNIYFEIMKLIYYRDQYFLSYWNAINLISTSLNTLVIIADLADLNNRTIIPILSVAVLFMWVRILYFGRLFFSTAWMVRMISSVTKDMRYFLFLFIYVVAAFGDAYLIISRNGDPSIIDENYFDAFVYSYQNGLGEFDLDNFDSNRDRAIVYILWVISTFLTLVVFLNLLIAIISDIFDKIHENIQNNLMKELVYFMVESEVLIDRKNLFKKHKYIILISKEKSKTVLFDAETKLQIIKNSMDKQIKKQQGVLDSIFKNLKKESREKIQNRAETIEISMTKKMGNLSKLVDQTEAMHNQYQMLFDSLMRIQD